MIKATPLRLAIPLPPGWKLQEAYVRHPEGPPVVVDAQMHSNRVHCQLPSFEFYSMLDLKLKHIEE
jgi:hypothetical protein